MNMPIEFYTGKVVYLLWIGNTTFYWANYLLCWFSKGAKYVTDDYGNLVEIPIAKLIANG